MNIRLNALVARGDLLSASVELSKEDNDVTNVINGDITWIIKLGIIPGLKSLEFKKKYDVDALNRVCKQFRKIGGIRKWQRQNYLWRLWMPIYT